MNSDGNNNNNNANNEGGVVVGSSHARQSNRYGEIRTEGEKEKLTFAKA